MKIRAYVPALLGAVILGVYAGALAAADKMDIGKREYQSNCVVCHGEKGKGDGSYGELLKTKLPDLTLLSKKNGGVFPVSRVYEVIDGRQVVKAHGTREMPVWGVDYVLREGPQTDDYPYDRDVFVRARILALIEYLSRLQVK